MEVVSERISDDITDIRGGIGVLGLSNKKVTLVEHSEEWKIDFEKEAKKLQCLLGELAIDIQHVGSTSIPGMIAKPIIDIAIAVEKVQSFAKVKHILCTEGYFWIESAGSKDRLFFAKGEEANRTHNIHVELYGGESWRYHIEFRDFLIAHAEYALEYCNLKKKLAQKYKDERLKYTESKDKYIKNVLEVANLNKNEF